MCKLSRSLVLLAVFTLVCGGMSTAWAAPKYTIKVGYESHPGEAIDLEVRYWAKLVDERSNGTVKLEPYPSSQLGSKLEVIEQGTMGANVCVLADPGFLGEYVPDLTILSGPYFAEWDKLFKLIRTDWFKEQEAKLYEKGLLGLSYNWMLGSRNLVANKPVLKPEDFKGLKIRVPSAKIQIEAFKAMGATPTPMPLSEVYTALTQGVIDGAENPTNVLYGQKHFEAAPNLMLIESVNMLSCWMIGRAYAEKLPQDVLQMLKETCDEAGEYSKKLVPELDDKAAKQIEEAGAKVFAVDKELFREAARPTYDKFPEWTPNLYNDLQKLMESL